MRGCLQGVEGGWLTVHKRTSSPLSENVTSYAITAHCIILLSRYPHSMSLPDNQLNVMQEQSLWWLIIH